MKEKVYIVLSHKNSLKNGSRTEWEVTETVEFVNQLRKRHETMSSVVADYLDEKVMYGRRFGFEDYETFDDYIREKYVKQLTQLDSLYKPEKLKARLEAEAEEKAKVEELAKATAENSIIDEYTDKKVVDEFGNVREKTVFDHPDTEIVP